MNDVLGNDRRRFIKLGEVHGEVNPEFMVGRPVDSVSDASEREILNYASHSRTS